MSGLYKHTKIESRQQNSLYETLIRPTMTYACEMWILNRKGEDKENLEKWERRILREFMVQLKW